MWLGHVAINIEIPGDGGQGESEALKLLAQHNLTTQSRVVLEAWSHVQEVLLSTGRCGL